MILSIIIPAYNPGEYIYELLNKLKPQLNDDIEVIVVDDGSKEPIKAPRFVKCIRQENQGVSAARNRGLDEATGEYIAFIDADDLVTEDYIKSIMQKIEEGCDYIYLSWKTTGKGWQATVLLKSIDDVFPPDNLCVWNRVYRHKMIGKKRFNTKKLIAEDAEFIRIVETKGYKKGFIEKPIYLYRSDTPNSLSKRFAGGELNTKRIVYYFKNVSKDMKYLLRDFKIDDQEAEVILMTHDNQIPELKKYAMVIAPRRIRATEKKGESCELIEIIEPPIKTQVVLWTHYSNAIGGIETFTYYFAKTMAKYYDLIILYDKMDPKQIERVSKYAECRKNNPKISIECDTIIVNRIVDQIPQNIHYKQSIQMVHGAKINYANVPQDRSKTVCVSEYVKETWEKSTKDATVIHNVLAMDKSSTRPLLMVTASRLDAKDKGLTRMIKLGKIMDEQNVPYIWICFSNAPKISNAPKGMIFMPPTLDIIPWVEKADYLVQLSDEEAFCYSLVEALEVKTAVITTPLPVLGEIGVKDKKNGYVIPFEIPDDFKTKKFLEIPKVEYEFDNQEIIEKWRNILGNTKPTHKYVPPKKISIECIHDYYDTQLMRNVRKGERIEVSKERAEIIRKAGYARREY